jgi:hypothetical protein
MYANPERILDLTRDLGVFATCLFASVAAGHVIFLVGTDSVNHPTFASLGPLWVILFFAPCLFLGYFARRLQVLQSVAVYLVAYVAVESFDYVPLFKTTLIPAHPSREFLVTTAAWFALAAFLGVLGALLKKYMTKRRSRVQSQRLCQ